MFYFIRGKVAVSEPGLVVIDAGGVGYGRAEKKQVMEMTRALLGLKAIPRPDDAADALAIALCHGHTSGSLLSDGRQV